MRMSLKTVMNPHMKKRMVMIANGPRYDFPFSDGDEVAVCEVVTLMLGIGFIHNPETSENVKHNCGLV